MIQQLKDALVYIKDGKGVHLENDVFLCGDELDGSDKIYGFKRIDGELMVESRSCVGGYPIQDLTKQDLEYVFLLSEVGKNLVSRNYRSVPLSEGLRIQTLSEYSHSLSGVLSRLKSYTGIVIGTKTMSEKESEEHLCDLVNELERAIDQLP